MCILLTKLLVVAQLLFFFALVDVVNKGIHKGIHVDIAMNGKIGSVPYVVGVSMTYV